MDAAGKFNLRNPAVKRILQEMKEMQRDTASEFVAEALEDDIFEWHFVIRGPPDTEFEGGLYHGRILLPPEYPFKPPSFVMLTPSGRFEVGKKICLSISERHPEHWQPSWSMRTALMALVAFLPTKGKGAIGSLDFPEADRRLMAQKSRTFIPVFPNEQRQQVAITVHNRALEREEAKKNEAQACPTVEKEGPVECLLDLFRSDEELKEGGLVTLLSNGSQAASETIKSAAATQMQSSSQDNPDALVDATIPDEGINEADATIAEAGTPGIAEVTDSWVSSREVGRMNVEQLQGGVGDKEWMWSAAMWAVGFVILALVAKKILVRAGVDIWAFIE